MTPERMKQIRAEIESAMSFKTPALRELGATAQWLVDALVVERDRVAELDAADLARSATIRGLRQRVIDIDAALTATTRLAWALYATLPTPLPRLAEWAALCAQLNENDRRAGTP